MPVAGVLAIGWGGLARVGEVLAAKRSHLVLPADVGGASSAVHISDMEPKTRYRAARHQCLKIDQPQLVQVIELAFTSLRPEDKHWTMSGSTLSTRFDKILGAL